MDSFEKQKSTLEIKKSWLIKNYVMVESIDKQLAQIYNSYKWICNKLKLPRFRWKNWEKYKI